MHFEKNSGKALIFSTFLMVFTMVLHPTGGNMEHLLKVANTAIIAHSIAIVSIPFTLVGFWALTKKLGTENFLSIAAFAIIFFGLIGVMFAAMANGLVLPMFIMKYKDASPEIFESLKPILKFNASVNQACDYVYMGGFCLSMLFWSMAILRTKKLPKMIAYTGIVLFVLIISLFMSGFILTDLNGFRIFVGGSVLWIALVGFQLMKEKTASEV